MSKPVAYSVLDLCPIVEGGTAADAFANSLDLIRHAERTGYTRYWVAEHHNIPGVASSATAVVIAHLAGGTSRIRVGSGGIMLPNHAPLMVAEQFGTLASLFPGRIDLGLGRAPGGDMATARALRRNLGTNGDTFPQDLIELRNYFGSADPATAEAAPRAARGLRQAAPAVRAIPGYGLDVPIYLLGSSDFSALLAAEQGLPFAFASHFAPEYLQVALGLYRNQFQPSAGLAAPHAMVGVNVFAAETDEEARRLFTSLQQAFLGMVRGARGNLPPPIDSMHGRWSPAEQSHVDRMLRVSVVGSPSTVRTGLERLIEQTDADEIVTTAMIFDHAARVRSLEITAEVMESLHPAAASA